MGVSTDAYLVYGIQLDELQQARWEEAAFDGTSPVDLERHCSDEYTMYTLVIKDSVKHAWRGEPCKLETSDVVVESEWDDQLKDACEKLGIDYEKPYWWLQSYSG